MPPPWRALPMRRTLQRAPGGGSDIVFGLQAVRQHCPGQALRSMVVVRRDDHS